MEGVENFNLHRPGMAVGTTQEATTPQEHLWRSGKIHFHSDNVASLPTTPALLARIQSDADLENCWKGVCQQWDLPLKPQLLICMAGGDNQPTSIVSARLKAIVRRNIFSTAYSLKINTWVITDGLSTPLTRVVGEAVRGPVDSVASSKAVALGVASLHEVANSNGLDPQEDLEVCHYNIEEAEADGEQSGCRFPLNHHHTHFLFAECTNEDGRTAEDFRRNVDTYLSKTNDGEDIPLSVLMVVGGDSRTLARVVDTLKDGRRVLVLSGTGGTADLLTYTLLTTTAAPATGASASYTTEDVKGREGATQLTTTASNSQPHPDDDELLLECQRRKDLIHFFDTERPIEEEDEDTDRLFCFTLLHCAFSSHLLVQQIMTAIEWDCVDFVSQVLSISSGHIESWRMDGIQRRGLIESLLTDKVALVRLFVGLNLDLQRFLSLDTLCELYEKSLKRDAVGHKLFHHDIKVVKDTENNGQKAAFCRSVDNLLEKLLGDARFHFYSGCFDASTVQDGCLSEQCLGEMKKEGFYSVGERGLFLWALLFRRHRLAYLFWKLGQDQIGGAVCASQLMRKLSEKAEDSHFVELGWNLEQSADLWEKRAVDLLTVCFTRDVALTKLLLQRPLPYWGYPFLDPRLEQCCRGCQSASTLYRPTLLDLTNRFTLLDFAAHSAVQTMVADMWYGGLPVGTSRMKVFLLVIFPMLRMIRTSKGPCQSNTGGAFFQNLCDVYSAPVTRFFTNALSYVMFLAVLSLVVLCDMREGLRSVTALEIVLHLWMTALIVEDVGQIRTHNQPFLKWRLIAWFHSQWKFDLLVYTTYLVAVVLRLSLTNEFWFKWARAFFAITAVVAFQSCMQFFLIWETLGPKVTMIEKMWRDLFQLLFLCFILLVAFGAAAGALKHPGADLMAPLAYFQVLYDPYFQVHGELFLERYLRVLQSNLTEDSCNTNYTVGTRNPATDCPDANVLLVVLLVIYLALANIMMMNLMIGQMTVTFEEIHNKLKKVWLHQLLTLTQEYYSRPSLAPPLSLISYSFRVLRYCFRSAIPQTETIQPMENVRRLVWFEKQSAEKYFAQCPENAVREECGEMETSPTEK